MLSKQLAALAAASLMVTSTAAMAQPGHPAQSLSLAKVARASTDAKNKNQLSSHVLVGVLVTLAIVGGAIALTDGKKRNPISP